LARPIVLIPHLFRFADAINFRKDYSPPSSPPSRPFTFGEGSRCTLASLTPIARVLDVIVRRTLLSRLRYREGLTRMQLWVVHHLVSQTPFDLWDLMLCEMEDTLAEDFKGHRQLPYAHWICFIIRST
jgi:hypothetical protein